MVDIVIYTKPENLLHKMGMGYNPNDESDEAFGTDCEFFWSLRNRPNDIKRVFFATKGFIIGYFNVEECEEDDEDFTWYANTWTLLIEPIPTKSFQGFKYADKIPELNEYAFEVKTAP